jgi:hypothetical protein
MATERQIAANRRNALRSTGPRSPGGKRQSRHNAYRHGLSLSIISNADFAKRLEKLALKIAAGSRDPLVLECARKLAESVFELTRVRRAQVALIERALALDEIDAPQAVSAGGTRRFAQSLRRILPDLRKLERYETHAAAVRDRAIREMMRYTTLQIVHNKCYQ